MCGIAGTLTWHAPPDPCVVRRMADRLRHRGPDAEGVWSRGPIALGHRRLSIIDLSEANNQPLADLTGAFWLVFNGEIYNFQALRKELSDSGACFRTAGDSEVILEAYKRWGVECLQRFNGMFAFALWDEPRRRLFLARDRLGEKPLYYQPLPDGGLAFASELRALRAHPAVSDQISPTALGHYLALNYTLTSACMLEGVRKLPAAHYLVVEEGRPAYPVEYWDLAAHFRDKRRYRSEAEAAEALDALIEDSVRLRLVSDVPVGAFLSGGIDSATVGAAIGRLRPAEDNRTYSIGFVEGTFDERAEAREVAQLLGLDHHEQVVDVEMASLLPDIVAAVDEPLADTSLIACYFLARFARQGVTVALSGDGSDEIFAGYETYPADKIHRATRWIPGWLTRGMVRAVDAALPVSFDAVSLDYRVRKFLRGHPLSPERAHYFWRIIFADDAKRRLVLPEWRERLVAADPFLVFEKYHADVADCHPLDQALYVDIKTWLVDDILVKVDRATMAHSLEARAPFLDHRLVELAASLPPEWKLKGMRKKHLLKDSQRRHLPPAVVNRRKHGFNTPVSEWFQSGLADLARAATHDEALGRWFDRRAIDELWRAHSTRSEDNGLKLFGLACLGLWLRQSS